jgi:D-alanine-D-alanine ligase
MSRKISVVILFGGKSAEHEISLQSAKNIIEAIDKEKYEIIPIGIDKDGHWYLKDASNIFISENDPNSIKINQAGERIALIQGEKGERLINLSTKQSVGEVDVIFPILHGPFGEDGAVQGLLKVAGIPFVGCGVLSSAVCMDKDVSKRLLRDAGIDIADFLVFHSSSSNKIVFEDVKNHLGLPLFVKPLNMGSSVGINMVKDKNQFDEAVKDAFKYDNKILIEEFIKGREIECAVLGNDDPIASAPGEIIAQHDFYSYKAKYINENGAVLEAPAKLPEHIVKKVQSISIKAFKTLCCEGMGRVDVFLKDDEQIIFNEINTIPGFTAISMYPKLWGISGISFTELIDRLIQLALDRFENEKKLKTSF